MIFAFIGICVIYLYETTANWWMCPFSPSVPLGFGFHPDLLLPSLLSPHQIALGLSKKALQVQDDGGKTGGRGVDVLTNTYRYFMTAVTT